MKNNFPTRYDSISRLFHWLMALLIIWQLLKIGDRIADGEHWIGQTLVPWHISIGTLLLLLIVLRTCWKISRGNQIPQPDPATAFLVKTGHFLLYATMFLMPITGILVMVGGGYGLNAFSMQLIAKGEEVSWAASLGSLHSPISWLLLVLVVGHIAIALFHHFVKRDDTLQRML